jgi:hypothetical protein
MSRVRGIAAPLAVLLIAGLLTACQAETPVVSAPPSDAGTPEPAPAPAETAATDPDAGAGGGGGDGEPGVNVTSLVIWGDRLSVLQLEGGEFAALAYTDDFDDTVAQLTTILGEEPETGTEDRVCEAGVDYAKFGDLELYKTVKKAMHPATSKWTVIADGDETESGVAIAMISGQGAGDKAEDALSIFEDAPRQEFGKNIALYYDQVGEDDDYGPYGAYAYIVKNTIDRIAAPVYYNADC